MTTLAAFTEQAWNDHISDPDGVAARLTETLDKLKPPP